MKERPILFSAPMVRALLDGSKTQTRRVVKPWSPNPNNAAVPADVAYLPDFTCYRSTCPYGEPGHGLWVKETYRLRRESLEGAPMDGVAPSLFCDSTRWFDADGKAPELFGKLRPSIHMPRWASRILLEIVSVRVERLWDISEEDAAAEGVAEWARGACAAGNPHGYTNVGYYSLLWEQINGAGSWDADPWVWVITVRRVAC